MDARLRRHQLDARRRSRGRRRRRAGRTRRGGTAQRRPVDAGRAKPHRGRRPRATALRTGRALARDARGGRCERPRRSRRRRHARRTRAVRADRPHPLDPPRALWRHTTALSRLHDPSRGQRPPGPAEPHRRGTERGRGADRLSRASTHRLRRLGPRPARSAGRTARLSRSLCARGAGARDPHRLGRPAKGGVLVRRAVRHAATVDRVGRYGRGRRERPRRRRSGGTRARRRRSAHARRPAATLRRRRGGKADRGGSVPFAPVNWDVAVLGAGYVGLPLAQTFAEAGQKVVLVDVVESLIAALNRGESHIDAILIAVPTPLSRQREPDLSYIERAATDVAPFIHKGQVVILESTTYPGTTREILQPLLELGSGLKAGTDFHVAFSPERVDPGNREFTTKTTPKIVGGVNDASAEAAAALYRKAVDDVHVVSTPEAAELTKLLENIFRSVNIALVNELAQLCDRMDIDVWEVVDAAATKP